MSQETSREDFFATDKQKWYEFNDKDVTTFKLNQMENMAFGGGGSN